MTFGPAYDPAIDGRRVHRQMDVIRMFMLRQIPGTWLTLAEIEDATDYPQASVSAQLRHLRKERFGAWDVDKRRRVADAGTWEYRVRAKFRLEEETT